MTTRVYTNPRTGEILDDPNIRPFDEILRELGEDTIGELLREAINADLAKVEVGEYPLVTLTEKGELVMKGAQDYEMDWPVLHPAGRS